MVRPVTADVLASGCRNVGINKLLSRLEQGSYTEAYDPTQPVDFQKYRELPNGRSILLRMLSAAGYHENNTALWRELIRTYELFLLVYRVDEPSTLAELESLYLKYVVPKETPALAVFVVATCVDLLPANGTHIIRKGQELANKHSLRFLAVSAKTGEGCERLEGTMFAAVAEAKITEEHDKAAQCESTAPELSGRFYTRFSASSGNEVSKKGDEEDDRERFSQKVKRLWRNTFAGKGCAA